MRAASPAPGQQHSSAARRVSTLPHLPPSSAPSTHAGRLTHRAAGPQASSGQHGPALQPERRETLWSLPPSEQPSVSAAANAALLRLEGSKSADWKVGVRLCTQTFAIIMVSPDMALDELEASQRFAKETLWEAGVSPEAVSSRDTSFLPVD